MKKIKLFIIILLAAWAYQANAQSGKFLVIYKQATRPGDIYTDAYVFPAIPCAGDAVVAVWGAGGRGARTTKNYVECYAGGGGGGGFAMYKPGANGIGWPINQGKVSYVVVGEGGGVVDKYDPFANGFDSSFGNDYFGRIVATGGKRGVDDSTKGGEPGSGTYRNGNDNSGYTIGSVLAQYRSNLYTTTGGWGGTGNNKTEKSGQGGTSAGLVSTGGTEPSNPFHNYYSLRDGQSGGPYIAKNQFGDRNHPFIGNGGQGSGSPGSTHYAGNGDQPGGGGGAGGHDHVWSSTDHKNGANGWVYVQFNYYMPEKPIIAEAVKDQATTYMCASSGIVLHLQNEELWTNIEWYKDGTKVQTGGISYTVGSGITGNFTVKAQRRELTYEFEGATDLRLEEGNSALFQITITEKNKKNNGTYRIIGRSLKILQSGGTLTSNTLAISNTNSITPIFKLKGTILDAATGAAITDKVGHTVYVSTGSRTFDLASLFDASYNKTGLTLYYWKDGETGFQSSQTTKNVVTLDDRTETYHIGAFKSASNCQSEICNVIVTYIGRNVSIWAPNYGKKYTVEGVGALQTYANELRQWKDPNNWVKGIVPDAESTVYIPGFFPQEEGTPVGGPVAWYPLLSLSDQAKCRNIYFLQGGEITNLQYLTYDSAHVQLHLPSFVNYQHLLTSVSDIVTSDLPYDHLALSVTLSGYENRIERDRWYMLSAPLSDMVAGDYSFGGVPATFIRKFATTNPSTSSALQGGWSDYIQTTGETLKAGEGFALFVNPYREELTYRDQEDLYIPEDNLIRHEVGLRRLNGVLEWPYFDATTNLAGDIQRYGHRNHIYRANEKKSYFFNYLNDDLSLILDESFGVNRTEKAYKLNTSATITTSIVPIRGSDNHYFAMVGNPYMSTIDFDKFWADNSSKLKATKGYYVYIDGELEEEDTQRLGAFATYNNPSAYPYANNNRIDKYIAPMQAFIVELANGSVNALDFKIADISVARPPASVNNLRADEMEPNQLTVTASNDAGKMTASILRIDEGRSKVSDWDMTKILAGMQSLPEIYTLKAEEDGRNTGLAVNIIGNDAILIPLGLATTYTGSIRFTLSGMDAFNGNIQFIDTENQVETDNTGRSQFEYEFDYTPPVEGWKEEIVASENRFFIRVSAHTTGIDEANGSDAGVQAYTTASSVRFNAYDKIQAIGIFDVQGRLIYKNTGLNAVSFEVNKSVVPTVAVAQVLTEKGNYTIKLINK